MAMRPLHARSATLPVRHSQPLSRGALGVVMLVAVLAALAGGNLLGVSGHAGRAPAALVAS